MVYNNRFLEDCFVLAVSDDCMYPHLLFTLCILSRLVVEPMHLWDSNYHGQVSNQGIAYGGKHIINQYAVV